jgi:hypothetical protein
VLLAAGARLFGFGMMPGPGGPPINEVCCWLGLRELLGLYGPTRPVADDEPNCLDANMELLLLLLKLDLLRGKPLADEFTDAFMDGDEADVPKPSPPFGV